MADETKSAGEDRVNQPAVPASIRSLIDALSAEDSPTPRAARAAVRDADISPDELLPWADFDHPAGDSYGRKVLHDGGSFEIMVMSWKPGDYSAVHDHGHATWGAVQVFGPAEHRVYADGGDGLVTLSVTRLTPGAVLGVRRELVHQMGNPTEEPFLTLHVYGNPGREGGITADARVFDLTGGEIQTTDGGVFYLLPDDKVKTRTPAPEPDYHSWAFDTVRRLLRARRAGRPTGEIMDRLTDAGHWDGLKRDLLSRMDADRHVTDSKHWAWLYAVFREAAKLQDELIDNYAGPGATGADPWRNYARLYDSVIGTTNSYIPRYLRRVFDHYGVDAKAVSFLDVGCGTGWLQSELATRLGMDRTKMLGVDPSPGMLAVAEGRAPVRRAGLLDLDASFGTFDVTFCNSYQYLPHEDFEAAVAKMHGATGPGGLCVSEFIAPDHLRWYPNLVPSEDGQVMSLRNLSLLERDGFTYQNSEIINVSRFGRMRITHEGVHGRFVISPRRAFEVIEKRFGGGPGMYDAVSFERLPLSKETCRSTRFVVCARKA